LINSVIAHPIVTAVLNRLGIDPAKAA
jgi:hypothetical protein